MPKPAKRAETVIIPRPRGWKRHTAEQAEALGLVGEQDGGRSSRKLRTTIRPQSTAA